MAKRCLKSGENKSLISTRKALAGTNKNSFAAELVAIIKRTTRSFTATSGKVMQRRMNLIV
jgi:hypothetical protein